MIVIRDHNVTRSVHIDGEWVCDVIPNGHVYLRRRVTASEKRQITNAIKEANAATHEIRFHNPPPKLTPEVIEYAKHLAR